MWENTEEEIMLWYKRIQEKIINHLDRLGA